VLPAGCACIGATKPNAPRHPPPGDTPAADASGPGNRPRVHVLHSCSLRARFPVAGSAAWNAVGCDFFHISTGASRPFCR
jgi:hypothetical protein